MQSKHGNNGGVSSLHDTARRHALGQSAFLDDLPAHTGELTLHLVLSPVAKGRLLAVDAKDAQRVPGVVGVFTAADVPGSRRFGVIVEDEEFLVSEQICHAGQPVAVVAAETKAAARLAASRVHLDIAAETPTLSIEEAIARNEFFPGDKRIECGEFDDAWPIADHQLDGVLSIGGQEHCYLEPQASRAELDSSGGIVLQSGTQHPSEIQAVTAAMLGLRLHEVVVESSPMGGAFGGKETQAALPAMAAALVAYLTRRPARLVLDRKSDMAMTGKRHGYRVEWRTAFDGDGRIQALEMIFYSNGGSAMDLSPAVLERSLLHATNAYAIPNVRLRGDVCRTNLPPSTAFRGFGAPQAIAAMENVVEAVAAALQIDALQIRQRNCYTLDAAEPGRDITPYQQRLTTCAVPDFLRQAEAGAQYAGRLEAAAAFNRSSPTHLRGVSLIPVHFGISFVQAALNRANALVNLYPDGTIQVSTGATDMGQGANTKIRQLVAAEFGVPVDRVRVMRTSTEKNHNTSASAASTTTDLNGMAALNACRKILDGLRQFAAGYLEDGAPLDPAAIVFRDNSVSVAGQPECQAPLPEIASAANAARVDLGARGYYATPGIQLDWSTGKGSPFRYFTSGCAVTEVLVDRATGQVEVTQADVWMDTGSAINPEIDRGQVFGAFIQGMGWVLTERLVHDAGRLVSDSFSTYKIPTIGDVPTQFRVTLADHPDPNCFPGGKGVGEPPFVLGLSVWTAIKNALSGLRPGTQSKLDLPATPERVLLEIARLQNQPAEQPQAASAGRAPEDSSKGGK